MNVLGASQRRLPLLVIALLGLLLFTLPTMAADNGLTILSVSDGDTQQEYSVKLQILLLMTALSFLPAFILMATSFTRIIVVLAILRQALGLQQKPAKPCFGRHCTGIDVTDHAPCLDRYPRQCF